MSRCIECESRDTELFRGDDGHFRKECNECGHTGGPYVSSYGAKKGAESAADDESVVDTTEEKNGIFDY